MEATYWIILAVYGFVCGGFCAHVAEEKGRSTGAWFFGGLFCGILALIAVAGLPVKQFEQSIPAPTSPGGSSGTWKCMNCSRTNDVTAEKCTYCGYAKFSKEG